MPAALSHLLLVAVLWLGLGWAADSHAQELPAFEIIARNGRFVPETIGVPAGRRIKLTLQNDGPGPLEFENDDLRVEKVLGPGARSFVVLPPLKPGEYEFVDEFNPITGTLRLIAQ